MTNKERLVGIEQEYKTSVKEGYLPRLSDGDIEFLIEHTNYSVDNDIKLNELIRKSQGELIRNLDKELKGYKEACKGMSENTSDYVYERRTRDLNELTTNIKRWAFDRNLNVADPDKQFMKLSEEVGELAETLTKDRPEETGLEAGDIYIVLTILLMQKELDITECVYEAFQKIKNRKGEMVDGVFVKQEDLT